MRQSVKGVFFGGGVVGVSSNQKVNLDLSHFVLVVLVKWASTVTGGRGGEDLISGEDQSGWGG